MIYRRAIIDGMLLSAPTPNKERYDILQVLVAFTEGYIHPAVFNYILAQLVQHKSESASKVWLKIMSICLLVNLESYTL